MTVHRAGTAAEPLRVVVAGNAVAHRVVPGGRERGGGTYGEQLVPLLRADGIVADVRHTGRWAGMVDDCRRRAEPLVSNQMPDVVVLHYGNLEYRSGPLPLLGGWAVEASSGDTRVRRPLLRMTAARFGREVDTVIGVARAHCDALVLVVDVDPPGPRPGAGAAVRARHEAFHDELVRVVRAKDQEVGRVHLVPTAPGPADGGDALLRPDGLHRSAAGHALLAGRVAAYVRAEVAGAPERPA